MFLYCYFCILTKIMAGILASAGIDGVFPSAPRIDDFNMVELETS